MMNKKGSLELSVNVIVILIIALAVLGLVIGFVVSKFGALSSQIRMTEDTPDPTPQQPITFPGGKDSLTLEKKSETLMEIRVYNPSEYDGNPKDFKFSCTGPTGAVPVFTLNTAVTSVKAGSTANIPVSLKPSATTPVGRYACTMSLSDAVAAPGTHLLVSRTVFITVQ